MQAAQATLRQSAALDVKSRCAKDASRTGYAEAKQQALILVCVLSDASRTGYAEAKYRS